MRKILALTLSGIVVLGACGGNDDDKTSSQNNSNKKEKQSDKKESNNDSEKNNAQSNNTAQNTQQKLTKQQAIKAVKDNVLDGAGGGPGSQIFDMKVIKETDDNYHVEFKSGSENHGVVKQVLIIDKYTGQRTGYYQTDKGTNKMKEVEALQIAKNHFNGGVIRPGEIDFNSFQLEGAKSNNKYYFVRYNVTRLSEPIPFELKIDKDKKKVVDSKSLGTKKQMEELDKVSEEDERKDQEAKEQRVPSLPNNQDKQSNSENNSKKSSSDNKNADDNNQNENQKQHNTSNKDDTKQEQNESSQNDQDKSTQDNTNPKEPPQSDDNQDTESDEDKNN